MRRSDREITERLEIDKIIQKSEVCRIAFANNNKPYLVPVSFGYDSKSLYFHTAGQGKKIDYIEANNYVCFEFEGDTALIMHPDKGCKWTYTYESVIGYGDIKELLSGEEKSAGLNHIMKHYSGTTWEFDPKEIERTRVWKISIDSMTGKCSKLK